VLADATQMHQILMNLCANAEYAMRQTGGVLEVRLEAVEVEATGVGTALDLSPGPYVRLTCAILALALPGCVPAHLRTVLHTQGTERGHRHGPECGARHCRQPWGGYRGDECPRAGSGV